MNVIIIAKKINILYKDCSLNLYINFNSPLFMKNLFSGITLASILFLQGCVSHMDSRMFAICVPSSNQSRTDLDDRVKNFSQKALPYFNERVTETLSTVQYRSATKRELGYATGMYVFTNGGIVFIDEEVCDENETKRIIFHELIHHLDYSGKIDRNKFLSIYNKMNKKEYPIKDFIEYFLESKKFNTDFWKDADSERIAYTFACWYLGIYTIPDEMAEFGKTFLNADFVEKQQKSLYTN